MEPGVDIFFRGIPSMVPWQICGNRGIPSMVPWKICGDRGIPSTVPWQICGNRGILSTVPWKICEYALFQLQGFCRHFLHVTDEAGGMTVEILHVACCVEMCGAIFLKAAIHLRMTAQVVLQTVCYRLALRH